MEQLETVLQNWQQVKENEWIASCPLPDNHAHGDAHPSLAITQNASKVLVHCRAGCNQEAVWSALCARIVDQPAASGSKEKLGASRSDVDRLVAQYGNSPEVQKYVRSRGINLDVATKLKFGFAVWQFESGKKPALVIPHYADGNLIGIKARNITTKEAEKKELSQSPGSSIDGLFATEHLDSTASDVLVFEGCEDVALAMSHGFNSTGIIAAGSKVPAEDILRLENYKHIFLIGDQDRQGKAAMDALQQRLDVRKAIRVRLPGFKDIGDVWKAEPDPTSFKNYLRLALRQAQVSRENFDLEDLLTEEEIRDKQRDMTPYVVDKIIPMNSITMFFGEPKSGKSLLVTYILKCVCNGVKVFGVLPVTKRPVLYLDRENSNDEIASINEHFAIVGDEPIRYRTRTTNCPEPNDPGLIAFCEKHKPLLVFDSLTKFSKDVDVFNPAEMSDLFDKLLNLCAAGATVVIIHHAKKSDAEMYANSHQIGANVSRSFLVKSENHPKLHNVRLEGKLCRAGEPSTFHLIAFPVIEERGRFGLADPTEVKTNVDRVVEWIRTTKPQGCTREAVKKELKGMRTYTKLEAIREGLGLGRLVEREGILDVPERGNVTSDPSPFPKSGNAGNAQSSFEHSSFAVN
jgi:5S rRNA maturation endonuclease (ribonuclease M5)